MKSVCLAVAAVAMLSACQQPVWQAPASPAPKIEPAPALASVASLEGEWRVAGIDGQPLDQPVGLALSASADEIWWAPRCAQFERSYAIDGTRLAVSSARWAKARAPADRPPPCAIGLPSGLTEVFRAIDSATQVRRTPENGVLLSGGGHSLLLFSQ